MQVLTSTHFKQELVFTMMMVALGSLGMSISLPTGPVIFTSCPCFRSPAYQLPVQQTKKEWRNLAGEEKINTKIKIASHHHISPSDQRINRSKMKS
jgi:hypothetical protein